MNLVVVCSKIALYHCSQYLEVQDIPKSIGIIWVVLSDEQMSKRWQFSLLNDEQMSNKVRVEHQPVIISSSILGHFPVLC